MSYYTTDEYGHEVDVTKEVATLRAENVKLREALRKIRIHCEEAGWDADVARIDDALSSLVKS